MGIEKLIVFTDCSHDSIEIEKKVLNKISHNLKIFQCKTEEEVIKNCSDADGLINQFAPLTKRVIDRLEKCKIIARYGIGLDGIDLRAATERGVIVSNSGDYCTNEVANHTIGLILSFARGISQYSNLTKSGNWHFLSVKSIRRLSILTLGLYGYGKIAREIARKALCLGFSVIAYDPFVKKGDNEKVNLVDFKTLLQESDYLSIHCPLNNQTRHRFGENEFKAMKKSSYLLNVARGAVVNENALINALKDGLIAGAALDVLEKEPPLSNNPLLNMDNVIITPHAAFYSQESYREYKYTTANAIVTVLKGGIPETIVNKDVLKII